MATKKELSVYIKTSNENGQRFYDHTQTFTHAEHLDKQTKYEVTLVSAYIWQSYYNISAKLANNIFPTSAGNITLPDGHYSLTEFQGEVDRGMVALGYNAGDIAFVPMLHLSKIKMIIAGGLSVTFGPTHLIKNMLGFVDGTYIGTNTGTQRARFIDHNNVLFHCSLVDSHYLGSLANQKVLYTAQMSGQPSSQQAVIPPHLLYKPLINGEYTISQIRVWITDEEGEYIELIEPMSMELHIRAVRD